MPIEVFSQLRDRNQLTLPDRLATAVDAKPGDDLMLTYDESKPGAIQMQVLPRSYKGIAGDLYGKTSAERANYIAEERASWDDDRDSGRAPDGTPYLTFEESRRVYRQTDVTRERYDREPKLRWPKCEICGRSIANLREHRQKHARNTLTDEGVRTDPIQVKRSRARVRKWRATISRDARSGR